MGVHIISVDPSKFDFVSTLHTKFIIREVNLLMKLYDYQNAYEARRRTVSLVRSFRGSLLQCLFQSVGLGYFRTQFSTEPIFGKQ